MIFPLQKFIKKEEIPNSGNKLFTKYLSIFAGLLLLLLLLLSLQCLSRGARSAFLDRSRHFARSVAWSDWRPTVFRSLCRMSRQRFLGSSLWPLPVNFEIKPYLRDCFVVCLQNVAIPSQSCFVQLLGDRCDSGAAAGLLLSRKKANSLRINPLPTIFLS